MAVLNDRQREAAGFRTGACAVIAVPGSGKTLAMVERIASLVREYGASPESILGLTFTRDAAGVMRARLLPALQSEARRVTVSTIHSFCYSFLRKEGSPFALVNGRRQVALVRDVLRKLRIRGIPAGAAAREISLARNNLITTGEMRSMYGDDSAMLWVAAASGEYGREKARRGLLDLDDLLLETARLLREHPGLAEMYHGRYRHILVDEFQDVNPAQMEVIRLLAGGPDRDSSLWVCGDDWQSIYGFNGAGMGNLLRFREMYPGARVVALAENYRSTPEILDACHNLIRHNRRRIEKDLRARLPNGDPVTLLESGSEEDEALILAVEIANLVALGRRYGDMAVLYRANFQSRVIEECFTREGIPYRSGNGVDFYRRAEVRALLEHLRLALDPDSDAGDRAVRLVLNIPGRGLGKSFLRSLEAYSRNAGLHLFEGLKRLKPENLRIRGKAEEFVSIVESLSGRIDVITAAEAIQTLRDALRYDRYVSDCEIPGPDDARVQNINQLLLSSVRFSTVREFLAFTDAFLTPIDGSGSDRVRLMTVHRSKGMEFPVVFMTGMVEGVFPVRKGDLEDERRICFVGMSRARERLFLSRPHSWQGRTVEKSVFLDEIYDAGGDAVD